MSPTPEPPASGRGPGGARRISRDALWTLISSGADVAIVETLGPAFYASGHLPGAVNITSGRVEPLAQALLPDIGRTVVVYGSSRGEQPAAVARRLVQLGYRDVRLYAEGKEHWAEGGLPLEYDVDES